MKNSSIPKFMIIIKQIKLSRLYKMHHCALWSIQFIHGILFSTKMAKSASHFQNIKLKLVENCNLKKLCIISIFLATTTMTNSIAKKLLSLQTINFMHKLQAKFLLDLQWNTHSVNIYRYKAIGANATSSVILYTSKCISPCLEIMQLLLVILQPLQDYLQELKDFQTGANAFTGIQNYTGCCISPYSFVPINICSVCRHPCQYSVTLNYFQALPPKSNP